jgi:predicted transposase YbfD/YdcC
MDSGGAGAGEDGGEIERNHRLPELLEGLLLKGCIVTIDAIGSKKDIAAKIGEEGADYVPMVKNNQPRVAAAVKGFFETVERDGRAGAYAGRMDRERPRADRDVALLGDGRPPLPGEAVGLGGRPDAGGKPLRNQQSSKKGTALLPQFAVDGCRAHGDYGRGHWSIQNSLHWSLDVV